MDKFDCNLFVVAIRRGQDVCYNPFNIGFIFIHFSIMVDKARALCGAAVEFRYIYISS